MIEGVIVRGDTLIIREKRRFCAKKLLVATGFSSLLSESSSKELKALLKAYHNALNLGFPVEVRAYVVPMELEKYVMRLERTIETLELELESNPSRSDLRAKLARLKKMRDTVLKEGVPPLEAIIFYAVEACAHNEEEAIQRAGIRAKLLSDSLRALGIRLKSVGGLEARFAAKVFFRGFDSVGGGLIGWLLKRIIVKGFIRTASAYHLPFMVPALIRGTHRRGRQAGVYLGKNLSTGEEVFWNLENAPSPHIVVVGPTGSGKTELLAHLASEMNTVYGIRYIVIDAKGEYPGRLSSRGEVFDIIRLEDVSLGLSKIFKESRNPHVITEIISKAFGIVDERLRVKLYNVLRSSISADNPLEHAASLATLTLDEYSSYKIREVLDQVASLDVGQQRLIEILSEPNSNVVIDISNVFVKNEKLVRTLVLVLEAAMKMGLLKAGDEGIRRLLLLDEAWIYLGIPGLVSDLMRISRSYGVSVAVATQRIEDIDKEPGLSSDAGLFIAMSSPSPVYWESVRRYVKISEEIMELVNVLERGEGIVRIAPEQAALPVSFPEPPTALT